MAKGKPRWQKINAYELAKQVLQGKAETPEAERAGRQVLAQYRRCGRPQVSIAPGGKIVVR